MVDPHDREVADKEQRDEVVGDMLNEMSKRLTHPGFALVDRDALADLLDDAVIRMESVAA